uniref:DUF4390 domain-containing protein n=1 Tax=Rhodocyclus tenuis TaxID=1066 RepID=A0A840FVN6_RHOTE|nr:DUF4390 domain-containing protein [Rhodocyclus tenuis]MBB4246157.1 hypothetical protein [Rhodocyclus tenuis]
MCGRLFRSLLAGSLLLLASYAALAASSSEVEVRNPQLVAADDGWSLSADFSFDFNARLEEAVTRGVILYFVVDFDLARTRWYWLDDKVASRSQTFRLSYHALTRQYRLSTGALHQNFATLDEALRMLSRLRNWQVLDKAAVRNDETYLASLRMRLDLSQMPKTFQVSALANRDWSLSSDWVRWSFAPADSRAADARATSDWRGNAEGRLLGEAR